jgi:8-oxo-dGTP diphosphatase
MGGMDRMPIQNQVSSGGVAFRRLNGRVEIALISVGAEPRWQLPKGMIDPGETQEVTAVREVREEAGIQTEVVEPIDAIDFWFSAGTYPSRVRVHKTVHFFLLRYCSGSPDDHDHEVNEARWVEVDQAAQMLTYESERKIVRQAKERITILSQES